MQEEIASPSRPSTLTSSIIITVCFAVHIAMRYLVQLAVAAKFGAGTLVDSYLAALAVPEVISLVVVTAVAVTLVPILVEYADSEGENSAWLIATGFLNVSGIFLVLLTLGGYLLAPYIVRLSVPGFTGERFATTVRLFRILLPSAGLSTVLGGLSSIYYSRHSFLWPSLTLVLGTGINLVFILAFAGRLSIEAVALGLLANYIFRAVTLLPILRRGPYHRGLGLGHPGLRTALALMAPLLVGNLFAQANTVFDRLVGSWLPEGSISYLGYAYRLTVIVNNTVMTGIVTALLPVMSSLAARHRYRQLSTLTTQTFQAGIYIVMPCFIFLSFFAPDAIGLLLQRGRFDRSATLATATALRFYLAAGLFIGPKTALAYSLYALKRQAAVAVVGMGTMAVNIGLNFWLAHLMGYRGIALAHSIAIPINAFLLLLLLRRDLPTLQIPPVLVRFGLLLVLCLGLWWGVSLGCAAYGPVEGLVARAGKLVVAFLVGGVIYALLSLALKLPEALYVQGRLKSAFAGLRMVRVVRR